MLHNLTNEINLIKVLIHTMDLDTVTTPLAPTFEYDGKHYHFRVKDETILSISDTVITHEIAENIYIAIVKGMQLAISPEEIEYIV